MTAPGSWCAVADEEQELGDPVVEVHQQVAPGMGCRGGGGVRGDAEDVGSPGAVLRHEQHIEPAQSDGVEVEEVCGQQPCCLDT
jgi:hypothetical protein